MSPPASARPGRARAPLDLCDIGTVRAVTRRAGLVPQHRLGQNFLVDRGLLERTLQALEPGPGATVLEIGTGIGTLTAALAERHGRVVSVDLDPACLRAARITLRGFENIELIEADALGLNREGLGLGRTWLAAGNIPYQMTGALLSWLFEKGHPPVRAVLLVQREVAHRLAAGSGDWSLATVALRSVADIEVLEDAPPASFHPQPAVHSSLIRLIPAPTLSAAEREAVLRLARPAFQLRRKVLRHGITRALGDDPEAAAAALGAAGIDPGRRPGTLSLEEWRSLARAAAGSADA